MWRNIFKKSNAVNQQTLSNLLIPLSDSQGRRDASENYAFLKKSGNLLIVIWFKQRLQLRAFFKMLYKLLIMRCIYSLIYLKKLWYCYFVLHGIEFSSKICIIKQILKYLYLETIAYKYNNLNSIKHDNN